MHMPNFLLTNSQMNRYKDKSLESQEFVNES